MSDPSHFKPPASNLPAVSRRTVLKAGAAFTASLSLGLRRARAANEAADAAQKVHDEIWRRRVTTENGHERNSERPFRIPCVVE